eukprot:92221_1
MCTRFTVLSVIYAFVRLLNCQCDRGQLVCSDIEYSGYVWDFTAKGISIGQYTSEELQFIGCVSGSDFCSPSSFYCTQTATSMVFGTTSTPHDTNAMTALLQPGTWPTDTEGSWCATSTYQRNVCTASEKAASATKLCQQLGYGSGSVVGHYTYAEALCPQAYWDGDEWTSIWYKATAYAVSITCTEPCTSSPTDNPTLPTSYPTTQLPTQATNNPTNAPTFLPTNSTFSPTDTPTVPTMNPTILLVAKIEVREGTSLFYFIIIMGIVSFIFFVLSLCYFKQSDMLLRTSAYGTVGFLDTLKVISTLDKVTIFIEIFDIFTDFLFASELIIENSKNNINKNININLMGWISLMCGIIGLILFMLKFFAMKKLIGYQAQKMKKK